MREIHRQPGRGDRSVAWWAISEPQPQINDRRIPAGSPPVAAIIRQQVLEMPAPVVADALGYHPVTTANLAAQAGNTWSR